MDFERDSPHRASNATEEAPERAQADPATVSHEDYMRAVYRNDQFPQPLLDSPPRSNGTANDADSPRLDRRGDVRYKCDGSAEFRTEGVEMRTWARVTDISRTGCYVEMQATSPLHTTVNLLIEAEGIRVRTKGEVTTCYPLLGMGIAFKETLDADAEQLQRLLSRLESGRKVAGAEPNVPTDMYASDLLMITDPGAALTAVAKFLHLNHSLTREQFTQVVGKSQKRD